MIKIISKFKKIILLLILMCAYTSVLHADDKLAIGIGYPNIDLKYNFSKSISSEVRYATGDGINVYAGRFYWNFCKLTAPEKSKLFTGLEFGLVDFDTLDTKGTGYEGSILFGGEFYITKKLSVMIDFAPTLISLKSDDVGVDGVEMVFNATFYYYIF